MNSFKLSHLSLLILGFLTPLQAADPLAAVLPADSKFFLNVSSITKLREASKHPLLKSFTEGETGKALEPVMEKISKMVDGKMAATLKEETGLTLEEILAKYPGQAAAALTLSLDNFEALSMDTPPGMGASLVLDYTGDEDLMKKMLATGEKLQGQEDKEEDKEEGKEEAKEEDSADAEKSGDEQKSLAVWPQDYEEEIVEVEGAKIHEWKVRNLEKNRGDTMAWSVNKGKAFFAIGKTDLKKIVSRLATASTEGSLGTTAAWKSMPDSVHGSDVVMGVNLESMLGEVQEGMRVAMDKGELDTGGLPINPLQAFTGFGLDQLRMAFFSTKIEAEDVGMHMGLTYKEKPALVKIYAANGPGTPPAFVPGDVQDVGWGTMDWGKMFDAIKELAAAVSPIAAGGMDTGLAELKKMIGVDIRTDLFGQMGDDLWTASYLDPEDAAPAEKPDENPDAVPGFALSALALTEGQSQVIGIGLRDSKAFALSLKSMFNTLSPDGGLFEEREFMGKTIFEVKNVPAGLKLSWLIDNDTWILNIGKSALLDKLIGGMAKKPAEPLVLQPHVQAALAKLPAGGVSSSYADAGQLLGMVYSTLKPMMGEQFDGEAAAMIGKFPDKLDVKWQVVSRMFLTDQSADMHIRLSNKP